MEERTYLNFWVIELMNIWVERDGCMCDDVFNIIFLFLLTNKEKRIL